MWPASRRPTPARNLRRLLDGGLLAAYAQGRHRYYRLADERVAAILESLSLAPATAPWPLPTRADAQLRWARCCYRHLAGALGVAFCATLLQRDWLQTGSRGLFLQPDGAAALAAGGLELTDVPPLYGRSCLDWTEHRMHLGGPLGAMLTTAMLRVGWLRPLPHGRTLQPSVGGLRQLGILGVPLD